MNNNNRALHFITLLILILGLITSATGLLYTTGGEPYNFINQYGDTVKMYGHGLYAHDSYFKAPILRGSDFTILIAAIPSLVIALILDIKNNTLKSRLFLTSVLAIFTYYSASCAFGITYNFLLLVYIAFFSASLFGLIMAMGSLDEKKVVSRMGGAIPSKGLYIFLVLSGFALFAAWLPDIITALAGHRPLALIEVYTTEITYIIDMGIVSPVVFISIYQLKKRTGLGFILLAMLLTVCAIMGIMLPMQTVFQVMAGIEIPLPALITKMGSFVVLALFAAYFNLKLYKKMK